MRVRPFLIKIRMRCWLALASLHVLMWYISPARPIIDQDLRRWIELMPRHLNLQDFSFRQQFSLLLWRLPAFRTLLYYRIRRESHRPSQLLLVFAKFICPRWRGLWIITPSIGPGLYIEHGYSTAIGGKSIGANCWINQDVTIGTGKSRSGGPVIGDNVRIAAGAKVLGNITIGDNCTIAPNSYVRDSIPPNCTVVGVPAYVVRRDGELVKSPQPNWSERDDSAQSPKKN